MQLKKLDRNSAKTLVAILIIIVFIALFICGCSPYSKAFPSDPPTPVIRATSASNAVRMCVEREKDLEAPFDDVENVFVIPEELKL
ncbi:hypothetical protein [Simkania negevensis]|uniref:Uncharacterized protein n=1 Tax=Simkania negevensis (strain ATCC VR-1471 / DSM 27360 / Z) TaxID=331113 RepID=F8L2Y8_SIMNZ|nr:hypothetical protein [Simkania negevensis]CCB87834.1 unknown protein [Simkania negevensis Z]